ncbi:transglycosylase domain-containing protein [Globicatella sanguinis]|uniref:transglycosylase domain-containing protein n=1 Tax=Globicatella sanguinis TaxID=13076 RepID=UPI000ACC0239|nr:transglycosylase domain-containing protein [Globicatella sanguinis]MDK7630555.1 transglycosylase domain-containing protein [Globicatella sanguinis]WIK66723.1 transglycosylase domain-containing protein [Globicatella sanguinis]WKT56128.1 transglycosylase domain-containing protein [Globicatella sanguinis]
MANQNKSSHIWQGIKNLWRYYRGWKWLIFIGMTLSLILSSYLVLIAKTTSVDTLQEALMSHTTVLDINDEVAGTLRDQKGSYVSLENISTPMREVVVNTEDKRFYQHVGFDPIGMGRAFVRLIINRNTTGGGGSSITQQLVKNAFLTLDQTFNRKLKEFFLALEVEKKYTKDQILEMYLNHAYFGNGVWGIEDASMRYFGHSAATLDYNESMVLTGILKGPNIFNPIDDYEAAIDRRNVIADLMYKEGILSQSDVENIKVSSIVLNDAYYDTVSHEYPFYFDATISEAVAKAKIPEDVLVSSGYKIYTYLNTDYQNALDSSYTNDWIFGDDGIDPTVQSASVVVDPKTGGVMAVYGGRGEYTYRGFNRAIDMYRSPGSTIKPLAVYVSALERGYTIHSMVPDVVKGYGSDNYAPENYDRQVSDTGEVELYYALAQSKNTSAVYLMDQFKIDTAVNKLAQFGIKVEEEDKSLTLALGAMKNGVSPQQLASAYSAFSNDGVRLESNFIRRIEDPSGKVVYNNENPTKYKVMTANVSADMTSMMLDTYGGYGTAYGAGPDYGLIAGKTGSTEVSEGNMQTRDKWMVGYTPDFTIVTWVGLDNVGDGNLDELMPTGMGSLFNIQTTNLMLSSPQTPFNVQMASQMEADSNFIDEDIFGDSFKAWLEGAGETLNKVVDRLGNEASELWQSASEWLETVELPF